MPAIRPVRVSCTSSTARETPKSVSLTRPSSAISTLPGLTSRCTTPAACAAASPSATCRPISATTRGSSGPFSVSIAGQRLARQVLHDQPRPVFVHDDVEHADHVRVLQAGPDASLAHEPLPRLLQRVAARRRGRLGGGEQLLDRDRPVQQLVGAAPDGAHRARADPLVEPVPVADPGGIVGGAHRRSGYPPPLRRRRPPPVSESGLRHIFRDCSTIARHGGSSGPGDRSARRACRPCCPQASTPH